MIKPQHEAKMFALALIPHSKNNNREKAVLYVMLAVWATLELGIAFVGITPPTSIDWMRYLVLFIVGQMYGLERGRFREGRPEGSGGDGTGNKDTQYRLDRTDHSGLSYPQQENDDTEE